MVLVAISPIAFVFLFPFLLAISIRFSTLAMIVEIVYAIIIIIGHITGVFFPIFALVVMFLLGRAAGGLFDFVYKVYNKKSSN